MPLYLNEDQIALQDSARDFMAGQAPVAALRKLRDENDALGHDPALWRQFAEMGFTGILTAEDAGGLGLGHVEAGVVMEQVGRHLTASPLLASGIVAATLIARGGDEAQRAHWLPKLASGEAIATLAIDESAKHRPWAGHTAASAEGDGWVINGSKTFVPDGHIADVLLVVARSAGEDGEAEGLSVFIVPRDAAGVSVERTAMADAHNAARVTFTNVNVSRDALLGEPNVAAPAIEAALQAGRVAASAEMLGIADEVFERTMQYLKERKQFGKLIGEFQALQHRAAHLYTEIEITRAAVIRAQQALDADEDGVARHVQVAKARAGRTVTLAVQEAVQMHGGMGMTDAFDFGLFMKRARVLEELYGDANQHLNAFATGRGY